MAAAGSGALEKKGRGGRKAGAGPLSVTGERRGKAGVWLAVGFLIRRSALNGRFGRPKVPFKSSRSNPILRLSRVGGRYAQRAGRMGRVCTLNGDGTTEFIPSAAERISIDLPIDLNQIIQNSFGK